MIIDRFPLVMKDDEIKYRYDMINKALFNKNKIRIDAISLIILIKIIPVTA